MRSGFFPGLLIFGWFLGCMIPACFADDLHSSARTKIKYLLPVHSAAVFFSGSSDEVFESQEGTTFFRLTGLPQGRSILILFSEEVLYNGERVSEILFVPSKGEWPSYWSGSEISTKDAQLRSGIKTVASLDEFPPLLDELLRNDWVSKFLILKFPYPGTLTPFNAAYERATGVFRSFLKIPFAYSKELNSIYQEASQISSQEFEKIARKASNYQIYYPELKQDSILNALAEVRSATDLARVKTAIQNIKADIISLSGILNKLVDKKMPEEINRYKSAALECAKSLDDWIRAVEPEISSRKLESVWTILACATSECSPMTAKVKAGPDAMSPFTSSSPIKIKAGELLRMQAGIRYSGYPIEIIRTLPVNGKYSPEQKTLLSIALKAQEAGLKKLKPGVTLSEVQETMKAAILSGCKEAGILKNETDLNKIIPEALISHVSLSACEQGSNEPLESGALVYLKPVICIYPNSPCSQNWWGQFAAISDPVMLSSTGAEFLEITMPRTPTELESRVIESLPLNPLIR